MNARFKLVDKKLLKLFSQVIQSGLINEQEEYQYWYNRDFDFDQLIAEAAAHKSEVAESHKFLAEKYGAYDVATTWSPYSGLTVIGLVFLEDLKTGHPALEFCNRKTKAVYGYDDKGRTVYAASPNRRTPKGKELQADLITLGTTYGKLIEPADFILDSLGLFQQFGTFMDNGVQRVVPVRVWPLAMGLFIRTTKDRLYDIPEGFVRIPQCAMVMAQEVEAMLNKVG